MSQVVYYLPDVKTDRDKLTATYVLIEQHRLIHNQAISSISDIAQKRAYAKQSKIVLKQLLAERNSLIESIRPKNWSELTKDMAQEDLDALYFSTFGDRQVEKLSKTTAVCPALEDMKVIDLSKLGRLAASDPTEDFTTYTEVDPATYLDRTSTRTTFTHINNNIDAYVYKDFGAHHFNASFEHRFKVCLTYRASYNYSGVVWHALKQTVESSVSLHSQEFHTYSSTSGYRFYVYQRGGGSGNQDYTGYMTTNTVYYIEFEWDSEVGTYGTLYARIATGDYYSNGGSLVDTLSVTCDEVADFRYCYSICSWNYADAGSDLSGYMEYLDLQEPVSTFVPKVVSII
jgi:hypothetical protein